MTIRTHYLAAAAAIGALAVPAAAQTAYPYGNQQPAYPQYQQPYTPQQAYPTYQQPSYGQPAYGYNQGHAQNPVSAIIDGLLGNRYNVTDRQAVSQCASAAMTQASAQYGGGHDQGYGNGHNRYSSLRVTQITDVQRRNNGLRVKGLMASGYGGYDRQHGYQNGGYAAGDVTFRCNVDYRGAVTNVRIGRNQYGRWQSGGSASVALPPHPPLKLSAATPSRPHRPASTPPEPAPAGALREAGHRERHVWTTRCRPHRSIFANLGVDEQARPRLCDWSDDDLNPLFSRDRQWHQDVPARTGSGRA